jgi:hypothetical protein
VRVCVWIEERDREKGGWPGRGLFVWTTGNWRGDAIPRERKVLEGLEARAHFLEVSRVDGTKNKKTRESERQGQRKGRGG